MALLMIEAVKEGCLSQLEDYCDLREGNADFSSDKRVVVEAMVRTPEECLYKKRALALLTRNNFDFQSFFLERPTLTIGALVGMYRTDPTPETAEVAAILTSEYLRLHVLNNLEFEIDMTNVCLHAERPTGRLQQAIAQASARDSVIAVQNALVDYVRKEGPNMPMTRGAAVLSFLAKDVATEGSVETANFWTRKITGFREGARYSPQTGEKKYIKPQFDM